MATLNLKVLSRAVAKTQQVVCQSPRLIGEVTPKTPKTPASSPSRFFSPFFEEFEQSAGKQGFGGSPSKRSPMPRVPDLPGSGPRMLEFDMAVSQKSGASSLTMPLFQQQKQREQDDQQNQLQQQQQQQQAHQAATMLRASFSAAAQQELAASAAPAAELARQSFLARRAGRGANAQNSVLAEDSQTPAGRRGAVPERATLLGRGEDASKAPTQDEAPPRLPVLLGRGPGGVRRPLNYDDVSEKEIAEQVREAFLGRQSRIMGRNATRKVP